MKTECVISGFFRREHKRQRLSELQQETNELRRKLQSSQPFNTQPSPIAMLTAAAEMGVHATNGGNDFNQESHAQPHPVPHPQQVLPPANLVSSLRRRSSLGHRDSDNTESRILNHIELRGEEIDEIFQLYFKDYAQFLPILDPHTTPNSYYSQSSFLFWAIVGVGCRTYSKNPTLLQALSRSILEIALLSVISASPAWHTIQALLLVLTWPFPKDNEKLEITFPLCGLLLHIAMQQGLHIPVSSHEFYKKKLPAPSEADITRRSELWAYCVIAYQRSCAIKGQSPRSLMNLEQDMSQRQVLFQRIAPSLALQVKCQELVTRCGTAALEFGVRAMNPDQEKSFDILLKAFEDESTDLCAQATSATASNVVESIQNVSQRLESLAVTPIHMNFVLLLASVTLLRILKGPRYRGVDFERAKSIFFVSINLAKQMSSDKNDTCGRSVTVVNQLWNSKKSFRKPDGSEYIALRIRSRLALSPVVDALWWWRDEFDNQCRTTASSQGNLSDGIEFNRENPGTAKNACGSFEGQELIHFDDQFLADFEWAVADDALLAPTEPYGPIWSSNGAVV